MDIPTFFYHATPWQNEPLIKADNTLKPNIHNPDKNWMWLLNNHRELIPPGVWLCATLYNGDLPTISPYGSRRVRIPIDWVIQKLGGNVKLYAGVTDQRVGYNNVNTYVRLMLVRADANFEILKYMKELNIANNPLLNITYNPWLTLTGGYRIARIPIWVEIYVPYNIDVSNCPWDDVKHVPQG